MEQRPWGRAAGGGSGSSRKAAGRERGGRWGGHSGLCAEAGGSPQGLTSDPCLHRSPPAARRRGRGGQKPEVAGLALLRPPRSRRKRQVFCYFCLFKNFPQFIVIHTVKGFSVVSEAEVDVFLEFSCFLYDPVDVSILISGSSAFSKSSLYIWKISVHILLKLSLKDFEHNLISL